ncbi:YbgF trimerization domain-containing protein, partial [Sandarakinorhabdus oryzae]|uniref:YbgF trimerization domain-containing protein n=1 Tax=Sandarakinorhabdus oryzae TaxID=2675220 RepID=UPI002E276C3A
MNRLVTAVVAAAILSPAPLAAQAVDVGKLDRRVGTLESEMRAVQRKVFPGGNARYFEPEIPAQAEAPPPAPEAAPATTPIADLSARVDALEGQMKTMTGQIEALEYKLRQLDDGQRRLKGDVEFRLNALEHPGGVAPADGSAPPPATAPATGGAIGTGTLATAASTPPAPTSCRRICGSWPSFAPRQHEFNTPVLRLGFRRIGSVHRFLVA